MLYLSKTILQNFLLLLKWPIVLFGLKGKSRFSRFPPKKLLQHQLQEEKGVRKYTTENTHCSVFTEALVKLASDALGCITVQLVSCLTGQDSVQCQSIQMATYFLIGHIQSSYSGHEAFSDPFPYDQRSLDHKLTLLEPLQEQRKSSSP